jgi:hypothetical protein
MEKNEDDDYDDDDDRMKILIRALDVN